MTTKEKIIKYAKILAVILPSILSIIGIYLLYSNPYLGKKINLIITAIILILSFICSAGYFVAKHRSMHRTCIALVVFSLLVSSGIGYCDYVYYRLNSSVGQMTNTTEYVYTYLYTLKDSSINSIEDIKNVKIGLQNEASTTCHQTVIDGLNDKKITSSNYTTEVYGNFVQAAGALLNHENDVIAVDEQGLSMIGEVYPEFSTSTKQIAEFKVKADNSNTSQKVNISKEPFVVLINGVDTRTGDLTQGSNADVIMLAAFNPQTMKLSLISIPRDTYIPVTCRGNKRDKITHSGSGGVNCTIESLEQTFDININYYIKANFRSVVDLVDAIDGINVNVPRSFCEQNSKDEMGTICLEAGQQTLNGEQALALSRHRKTLPNGDIGRGLNQQIVIGGMIDKLASGKILTSVDKLLGVLGDNVQTNMEKSDMYGLFSLLTSLGTDSLFSNTSALQITSSTIGGKGISLYTDWAKADIYYYVPYVEAIKAVTTEINRVLGLEEYPLPNAKFSFNANKEFNPNDPAASKINSGKTPAIDTTEKTDTDNKTQNVPNKPNNGNNDSNNNNSNDKPNDGNNNNNDNSGSQTPTPPDNTGDNGGTTPPDNSGSDNKPVEPEDKPIIE